MEHCVLRGIASIRTAEYRGLGYHLGGFRHSSAVIVSFQKNRAYVIYVMNLKIGFCLVHTGTCELY